VAKERYGHYRDGVCECVPGTNAANADSVRVSDLFSIVRRRRRRRSDFSSP